MTDGPAPDAPANVLTDAALVRRVLNGNSTAFTVLVDRHAPACLRLATRMLQNRHDAEDVTQQTLLRAYKALGKYDEREQYRAWLFAILLNRCRTAAQTRARRLHVVSPGLDKAPDVAVLPNVARAELRDDIARAIAQLELPYREAFLLKHVEELSYEEMAVATGVGVSALKMRVKRACERLQILLGDGDDAKQ
ncbi:MAG: RNA polymerase sigma factor [Gemmatimonadaceae bacterium]